MVTKGGGPGVRAIGQGGLWKGVSSQGPRGGFERGAADKGQGGSAQKLSKMVEEGGNRRAVEGASKNWVNGVLRKVSKEGQYGPEHVKKPPSAFFH